MNAIILLFLIGSLLLAGEVFVPGAVLGIIGALCMFGGCVLAFLNFGVAGGALATAVAVALLGLMLYIELVWLPKTRVGKKMIVQSTVAATSQPPLAELSAVVGKTAQTVTPVGPTGYVQVEGRRYEGYSQSGHVPAGTTMRVSGLDSFRLILSKP
jgi:membrane-bound ClpP family serine protease